MMIHVLDGTPGGSRTTIEIPTRSKYWPLPIIIKQNDLSRCAVCQYHWDWGYGGSNDTTNSVILTHSTPNEGLFCFYISHNNNFYLYNRFINFKIKYKLYLSCFEPPYKVLQNVFTPFMFSSTLIHIPHELSCPANQESLFLQLISIFLLSWMKFIDPYMIWPSFVRRPYSRRLCCPLHLP